MRILHYTLGFPPERSGGLVNYVIDLANEQQLKNNNVAILYPGSINYLNKKTRIIKKRDSTIQKFELINSLPLALFGGINEPKDFIEKCPNVYDIFFDTYTFDVVHVHSLMGIHKEFFEAANKKNIPIIYTSHDYFGLAPEPNFFIDSYSYDEENSIENWIKASKYSLSTFKLRLFQNKFYPLIRSMLKKLNSNRNKIKKLEVNNKSSQDSLLYKKYQEYSDLKTYYKDIFKLIDTFHFNSCIAKEVFEKNLDFEISSRVLTITKNIKADKIRKTKSEKTRVAYIGPDKSYKGFNEFIKLVESNIDSNLEFHSYGYFETNPIKNIIQHGRYSDKELSHIYQNIDILIVPSLWKETFGLIVLESLYFETTVYVSENVGAKELLQRKYIFRDIEELREKLKIKNEVTEFYSIKSLDSHVEEICLLYNENLKN